MTLRAPGDASESGGSGRQCPRCGLWRIPAFAAFLPLLAHLLLFRAGVPLGCPGRFVYLYSPVVGWRLLALPAAVLLASTCAAGIWWLAGPAVWRRRLGGVLVVLGTCGLGVWSYVAPPDYRMQHVFNAFSPSQDGAFVVEALQVQGIGDYLRAFAQRAALPPAALRGTRVISNPPGTTLLALGVQRLFDRFPALATFFPVPATYEQPPESELEQINRAASASLCFFAVLTTLWVAAGGFLYLVGRMFWRPPVAAAYALCCVFSPMTLLFTPGKDPAQLLTVAIPLYLWLAAVRRSSWMLAIVSGVTFVLVCLVSLVHLWIGATVVCAALSAKATSQADLKRGIWRVVLPAGVSVLAVVVAFRIAGIDLWAIARAAAQAQSEVTRGAAAMPLAWQLAGIPLFLLFAGPAWWVLLLRRGTGGAAAADARRGRNLLLLSVVVMLGTIGFTNLETPRLWIPFTPVLLLGAMLWLPPCAGAGAAAGHRTRAAFLALLVGLQITTAAVQWSLMDAREAETRLLEQRFFE